MIKYITEQIFLENRVLDYLNCVLLFISGVLAIKLIIHSLIKRLKKWAQKTATTIDDFLMGAVERIILPSLYFGVFYLSVNILTLAPLLERTITVLGTAVLTVVAARLILEFVSYGLKTYWLDKRKNTSLERSLKGMLNISKLIVWSLAIIFFLDNLGFKISTVLAGLGIGGVAVALAAQAILGDLFSYFAILFDRPFEVGDFIILDDYLGTVDYVGIKTTRICSLGGEQLVFANTDLTNSRVRNYKKMQKRRVVFKLGVTYPTPVDTLKKIPGIIENIIKNTNDAIFDRAHFSSYGDFNLIFEVVYYVIGPDYNKYMDVQQKINFAIKEEFEKQKIEFAYPTQTLYLNK